MVLFFKRMESSHGSFNPFSFGDQAGAEFRTVGGQTTAWRDAGGRRRRLGDGIELFVNVRVVQ